MRHTVSRLVAALGARRQLAISAGAGAILVAGCAGAGPGMPSIPAGPRELSAGQQVQQALDRLAFGPRPGDVDAVRRQGVDRWIERQLHPERIPDTLLDRLLARDTLLRLDAPTLFARVPPPGRKARAYRDALKAAAVLSPAQAPDSATQTRLRQDSIAWAQAGKASYALLVDLQRERLLRAAFGERQLQEVMTDFWENHFSVWSGKGEPMRYMLVSFDRDVVRPRALGRFRDLLGAVAHSPAMLYYLDNWRNGADPSEPTLAQLMCEATGPAARFRRSPIPGPRPPGTRIPGTVFPVPVPVGRGPDCSRRRAGVGRNENYARELMELHTLGVDGGYTQHDVIEVARAFSGWTVRAPDSLAAFEFNPAMHDAGQKTVLGRVLKGGRGEQDGEEVLDLLARQPATAHFLATKLVRHFVADDPPPALVERAAQAYLGSDGDIRTVLRTIVRSPELWSRAAFRTRLKSPFELVASTVRALAAPPDTTPRTIGQLAYLGQPIWGLQTPNGWPDEASGWLGSDAMIRRMNFGLNAAAGSLPGTSLEAWRRVAARELTPGTEPATAVATLLLGDDATAATRAVLDSVAAAARGPAPRDTALATADPALLRKLLGLALGSPAFQEH